MSTADHEEFYNDLAHLESGPGRKRQSSLTEVIPIRLSKDDLDRVRTIAAEDGRTASAWIRLAILKELESASRPPEVETESTRGSSSFASSSLAAVQPAIVLEPFKVIAAQIVATAEQVVVGFERAFERIATATEHSRDAEEVFVERVSHDSDSFIVRPRRFDRTFAAQAAEEVQSTQLAIVRLVRLAQLSREPTLIASSQRVRDRIRDVQGLVATTEKQVISHSPQTEFARTALAGFFDYVDWARATLATVDEELGATAIALSSTSIDRSQNAV